MIETIITSSILILIIIVLRYLLRGKISSRLQYALWALVAVRLLLPFSLFENPVSVMNAIPDIHSDYSTAVQSVDTVKSRNPVLPSYDSPAFQSGQELSGSAADTKNTNNGEAMARFIWLGGLILSGAFFAASNIRLSRKLRQSRKQIETPQYPVPVYVASGLPSPCLYGIVKPAVYITPESLFEEKRTVHVIAHELTHYRQKDHIWSFVRVFCLCIHWFNPLVWLAAILSRLDSELACDEGTLRRIGTENRAEYGRTLIEMTTAPLRPLDIFCCATTMTGDKGEMKERIKRIAKQPKTLITTLVIVVFVAVAAVAFTFGGAAKKVPIVLPQSGEMIGISIEQINEGESLGAIRTSQREDVEQVLNALTDTDKTLRESINDVPKRDNYFQIDIDGSSARCFYLYNNGEKYYVEEPYVGVYRTNRETSVAIAKVYTANGGANLGNVQALWNAQTPYVGDNSTVSKLLGLLPLPSGLLHDHFALRTTGTERGLEWVLKGEDKISDSTIQQLDRNALLLFSLIGNLEDFYVTIDNPPNEGTAFHYIRSWADGLVGGDVRDYAESKERLQALINFSVAETPSYSMAKLKNGEVISEAPLESELAEAAIMDVLVKSAAWEGVDITTLKECYLIRRTFPKADETHDYYAYLLEDGRAVLQSGTAGQYSILSQELYSELINSWDNLTADPWLENKYTDGVPRPAFGTIVWIYPDEEKEYCAVCYQDVGREQIEGYLQTLAEDGWQTIGDFYEDTTVGGLYEKDNRAISIQFAGAQVVLYFSLK
ncbi:MAG: DUF5301 domain-containing protein [Lachnospiraceae bacterium]